MLLARRACLLHTAAFVTGLRALPTLPSTRHGRRHLSMAAFANVEKSDEDQRAYRVVSLPKTGVRCMLVSDPRAEKRAAAAMSVAVAGYRVAPRGLDGLAHYLEHMVLLGSHKYPVENHYKRTVAKYNGRSNAATAAEDTTFRFEVDVESFEEVLDVFAQFFVGRPLLSASVSDRELMAVDAEDARNRLNDARRFIQVLKHTGVGDGTRGAQTFQKFSTGNANTLSAEAGDKLGVNVRAALLAFRDRFYTPEAMTMAVVSSQSLDDLQATVDKVFAAAAEADVPPPADLAEDAAKAPAVAAAGAALVETAALAAGLPGGAHPWDAPGAAPEPFVLRLAPVKSARTLRVLWPLPGDVADHRSARGGANRYISHLLGHEGEGSIFAALQSAQLATTVGSSTYVDFNDFCALSLTIGLTPEGERRWEDVLAVVFEYVGVLRRAGVGPAAQKVWEEKRQLDGVAFRYAERGVEYTDVARWAKRLHTYGPEHVLSAGAILGDFPSAAVGPCLELLSPEHAIVAHVSKIFEPGGDAVPGHPHAEPSYDVPYTREPMEPALLARLQAAAAAPSAAVHLPDENPFLAADFDMVTPADADVPVPVSVSAPPLLLRQDARVEHWHKTETAFGKPKAHVVVTFASPAMAADPCHAWLWLKVLRQRLATRLYGADLAGLAWAASTDPEGFTISFAGFNDKLPELMDAVVGALLEWEESEAARDIFSAEREKLARTYASHSKSRADDMASYYLRLLMDPTRMPVSERAQIVDDLTFDDVSAFHTRSLRRVGVRALTYGNLEEAAAVAALGRLETALEAARSTPLPQAEWPTPRVVEVGAGAHYRLRLGPQCAEENNSGLVAYFQLGPMTDFRDRACLYLLLQLMKEPLFTELRTRQQLGYAVHSGLYGLGRGQAVVRGLYVRILSKRHAPPHLSQQVEEFVQGFGASVVDALSEESFEATKKATATKLREPPKTLSEQFGTFWLEIDEAALDWDRSEQLAAQTLDITKAEVRALLDGMLGAAGKQPAGRVSVQVFGNPHVDQMTADDGLVGAVDVAPDAVVAWRNAQPVFATTPKP